MAESFGVDAGRYDRTRPRYPEAMVERIIAASPGREILDVGCGTGIAARQFQRAGCAVLGVEPDSRMAEFARRRGVAVEVCAFETWEPGERRFDVVTAGQAWHWIEPVAGTRKAAHSLRLGGRLALFWNSDQPPAAVTEPLREIYRRLLPDAPVNRLHSTEDAYSTLGDKASEGIRRGGGFSEPEVWSIPYERRYSRDEYVDLLPTQGLHTRLPAPALNEILTTAATAIDEMGGEFLMRGRTVVVTAVRA